jgi:hypothetical protein
MLEKWVRQQNGESNMSGEFDDYESADLEVQGEAAVGKDVPLGSVHDDDLGAGLYDPAERLDRVEAQTRASDYENTPGRSRTGHDGELDLSRVSLEGRRGVSGDAGADVPQNLAYEHDSRGDVSQRNSDVVTDKKVARELMSVGVRVGYASVNVMEAGFALANAAYMKNKNRWYYMQPERKELIYAQRRVARANRAWEKVREDSIARHRAGIYKGFVAQRSEDEPYWTYFDDTVISRMEGIDMRSAEQMATAWRHEQDEKALRASVVRYAAFLEDANPKSTKSRCQSSKKITSNAQIQRLPLKIENGKLRQSW